jgi:delta8-fatty-acid desaturase
VWHLDERSHKELALYAIGRPEPVELSAAQRKYNADKEALFRAVEEGGMYDTDVTFFVTVALAALTLGGLSVVALQVGLPPMIATALSSLLLALSWHQSAWLGHDLMHNSPIKSRVAAHWVGGLFGNAATGISVGWWKLTHNMHHATVNEWDQDPDITHMPIFAMTEAMFLSSRPSWKMDSITWVEEAVFKLLVPIQHILYFPIMAVARFNLYAQGALMLILSRVPTMPNERVNWPASTKLCEAAGLIAFWVWYTSYLRFLVAEQYGFKYAVAHAALGHLYMAILHIQITLSHWERPMAHSKEDNVNFGEWIRQQVTTGRNINANWFTDWYWGGLHYQIEHHVFPRVPRHNLARLKLLLAPFLEEHGLPYCTSNFGEALSALLNSLRDVTGHIKLYDEHKQRRARAQRAAETRSLSN